MTASRNRNGRFYFRCKDCDRRDAAGVARLLGRADKFLPACLPPEVREDVRQEIALDFLSRKLRARSLTPGVVRGYVARARGMAQDRYRFISLSQPTRDGREFGELLAA